MGEDSVAPVQPEDRAGDGEDDTEDGDDGGEDDQIFSTVLTQELSSITRKKISNPRSTSLWRVCFDYILNTCREGAGATKTNLSLNISESYIENPDAVPCNQF